MAYMLPAPLWFGTAGLTLRAQLYDASEVATGALLTSGYTDKADGWYYWSLSTVGGHTGYWKVYATDSSYVPVYIDVTPAHEEANTTTPPTAVAIQALVAAGSVASVVGAVGSVTGSVGSVASGGITAASIATDAIGSDELAASAVTKIAAGITIPAASSIAAAVWGYALSSLAALATTTAGRWIYNQLALLGAGSVTVSSPVASDLTITLYARDDYTLATERITWTYAAGAPDFTGGTVAITTDANATVYAGILITTGPNIPQVVGWGPTTTTTDDFTTRPARYKVTVILATGERYTRVEGALIVKPVP